MTFRRLAMAIVLAGILLAGGAVAALAHVGSSPVAGAALGAQGLTASLPTLATNQDGAVQPGRRSAWGAGGNGFGHGRGFGIGRGGLTVTSVSGNTIKATTGRGVTVTVNVSAATAYTEAGASASLADVHPGSIIAVRGTRTTGVMGTVTVQATAVLIVLPREAGVVTAVNGSTLTLTGFDGASHTITVDSATRYQKAGQSATLADVTAGTAIVTEGTLQSDGSLHAVRITIQLPRIGGQVSAVNGTSYTVSGRFGTTYTVAATGSTTYVNPDGTTASATAIKTGTFIIAEGTLSADGKTLTALRIVVLPAAGSFGPRHFGRHGFGGFGGPGAGFGGHGWPGSIPGRTAPSTTGTVNI